MLVRFSFIFQPALWKTMLRHCLILLTALIWASCASQESDSNETTDAAGEQAVDTVQVTRSMEDSSDGPVLEVGDVSHIQEVASGRCCVNERWDSARHDGP
jgi:PBP1b-binding outer membrane lipoprotein LpoB